MQGKATSAHRPGLAGISINVLHHLITCLDCIFDEAISSPDNLFLVYEEINGQLVNILGQYQAITPTRCDFLRGGMDRYEIYQLGFKNTHSLQCFVIELEHVDLILGIKRFKTLNTKINW